jgi:hypothetical protein
VSTLTRTAGFSVTCDWEFVIPELLLFLAPRRR